MCYHVVIASRSCAAHHPEIGSGTWCWRHCKNASRAAFNTNNWDTVCGDLDPDLGPVLTVEDGVQVSRENCPVCSSTDRQMAIFQEFIESNELVQNSIRRAVKALERDIEVLKTNITEDYLDARNTDEEDRSDSHLDRKNRKRKIEDRSSSDIKEGKESENDAQGDDSSDQESDNAEEDAEYDLEDNDQFVCSQTEQVNNEEVNEEKSDGHIGDLSPRSFSEVFDRSELLLELQKQRSAYLENLEAAGRAIMVTRLNMRNWKNWREPDNEDKVTEAAVNAAVSIEDDLSFYFGPVSEKEKRARRRKDKRDYPRRFPAEGSKIWGKLDEFDVLKGDVVLSSDEGEN